MIEEDAADLPLLLSALLPAVAVVSGLPLYGLAADLCARIVSGALEISAGGPFVQFSYAPRFLVRGPWRVRRAGIVWRNLPPAAVFLVRA